MKQSKLSTETVSEYLNRTYSNQFDDVLVFKSKKDVIDPHIEPYKIITIKDHKKKIQRLERL